MSKLEIKATLEKQLQLLSEESTKYIGSSEELAVLTNEMTKVADLLLSTDWPMPLDGKEIAKSVIREMNNLTSDGGRPVILF